MDSITRIPSARDHSFRFDVITPTGSGRPLDTLVMTAGPAP